MTYILYFFYFILTLIVLFLIFAIFYFSLAYLLKVVPINSKQKPQNEGIAIWVISNGAHTDLIMPLNNEVYDWAKFLDFQLFKPHTAQYISIGWGDKGFYLDTPSWAELKASVAFKALFKLSTSCLQVVLFDEIPPETKWKAKVLISPPQYQALVAFIQKRFAKDREGQLIPIDFAGMPCYEHLNYVFFEGKGQYHLFYTCNCWANEGLQIAGVKTARWAPFAKAVFYHLPTENQVLVENITA
jgi:uncharacterized protein (TIGR02117 family)